MTATSLYVILVEAAGVELISNLLILIIKFFRDSDYTNGKTNGVLNGIEYFQGIESNLRERAQP